MLAPWMTEYDLRAYGAMQADRVRMDAYAEALRRVVTPASVVLDLGTGTGVMALLAARLGARRVVGVDTSPVVEIARRNAVACGLAERVEFVQGDSRSLEMDPRADVIVSDIRGVLPPLHQNAAVLADARARLLAPAGVLIPLRDELMLAPVCLPAEYERISSPWSLDGLDMEPARAASLNEWRKAQVRSQDLLAEPRVWAEIDYRSLLPGQLRGSAEWVMEREGLCHGLAGWFRAELIPGVGFSSGPGSDTVYGTAFFPWPRPVALRAGDRVTAALSVHSPGEQLVWVWRSRVEREGEPPVSFQQSPAAALPPAADAIRRRSELHVPTLGARGEAALRALEAARANVPLGAVADRLHAEFPALFRRRVDALTFAADLLESYGA